MDIADIATLKRIGPLLDIHDNDGDDIRALVELASRNINQGLNIEADSSPCAAAWLLCAADANAMGKIGTGHLEPPFSQNRILGFRGQKAVYNNIVPSLNRLQPEEQVKCNKAFSWFYAAISAWHNTHFRYRNGMYDIGGIEHEAALGVAQHYLLPTFLVDWTLDPLVALTFALEGLREGEEGVVLLRDFGDGSQPERDYNVLLPPMFLKRAWRQRALFAWHPVAPKDWDDPLVQAIAGETPRHNATLANYIRVTFPASKDDIYWARENHAALMADEAPELSDLPEWCMNAVRHGAQGPMYPKILTVSDLEDRCRQFGLPLPEFIVASRDREITEDIALTMDYLDEIAARRHPGDEDIKYFVPHLLTACIGMPYASWMKQPWPEDEQFEDPRSAVFFEGGEPVEDSWHQRLGYLRAIAIEAPNAVQSLYVERPQ